MVLMFVRASIVITLFSMCCLYSGDYHSFRRPALFAHLNVAKISKCAGDFLERRADDCFALGSGLLVMYGITWGMGKKSCERAHTAQDCGYGSVNPRLIEETDISEKWFLAGWGLGLSGLAFRCIGRRLSKWGNSSERRHVSGINDVALDSSPVSLSETSAPVSGGAETEGGAAVPGDLEVGTMSMSPVVSQRVNSSRACIAELAQTVYVMGVYTTGIAVLTGAFFFGNNIGANRSFYVDQDGYCYDAWGNPQTQISDAYHRVYTTNMVACALGACTYAMASCGIRPPNRRSAL